jgi:hypothetical protein
MENLVVAARTRLKKGCRTERMDEAKERQGILTGL